MLTEYEIASRWALIRPHLDERQRRVWLGIEATAWGEGGVAAVVRATGTLARTVHTGREELASGAPPDVRTRKPGGGRRRVEDLDPDLVPKLEMLVAPGERGDPMRPLRWTTDSVRDLADKLAEQGCEVSAEHRGSSAPRGRLQPPGQRQGAGGARTPRSRCPASGLYRSACGWLGAQ